MWWGSQKGKIVDAASCCCDLCESKKLLKGNHFAYFCVDNMARSPDPVSVYYTSQRLAGLPSGAADSFADTRPGGFRGRCARAGKRVETRELRAGRLERAGNQLPGLRHLRRASPGGRPQGRSSAARGIERRARRGRSRRPRILLSGRRRGRQDRPRLSVGRPQHGELRSSHRRSQAHRAKPITSPRYFAATGTICPESESRRR